ncbi:MAG: 6-phosphogluconolactonase [Pseudomonadota bacterium]
MTAIVQSFDTRERAATTLAGDIARALREAVAARGHATFVVSGGSSPLATYAQLAEMSLPWSKITVLPSDERWVGEDDPASNAGMLRRTLLQHAATAASFLSLYDGGIEAAAADAAMSARVAALSFPFDYVLLGMGGDGHTASLFPDDPDIEAALAASAPCVVARPPSQPLTRISLSPNALLNARHIALLFFGQDKAEVFAEANEPGDLAEYPVRSVLRQELVPVTTYFAQ